MEEIEQLQRLEDWRQCGSLYGVINGNNSRTPYKYKDVHGQSRWVSYVTKTPPPNSFHFPVFAWVSTCESSQIWNGMLPRHPLSTFARIANPSQHPTSQPPPQPQPQPLQ